MNSKKRNKLKPKIHIIFQKDHQWVVKGKTKFRISTKADTKEEAISLGKKIVKNQDSKLYIRKGNKLALVKSDEVSEKEIRGNSLFQQTIGLISMHDPAKTTFKKSSKLPEKEDEQQGIM